MSNGCTGQTAYVTLAYQNRIDIDTVLSNRYQTKAKFTHNTRTSSDND